MKKTRGITPLALWARRNIRIRNKFITHSISEFLGTFTLTLFAVGGAAQAELMPNEPFLMPVLASMGGLLIAVMCFGGASGAHVNPAVSIALAVAGELNWAMVPFYCISQFVGGYLGAGLAFLIYQQRLCISEGEVCKEAIGIFSQIPSSPIGTAFLDQTVTTGILLIFVFALTDPRNMKVDKCLYGVYFAAAVAGICFAFGINAGAVLNPARDLSPRLMAVTLGHPIKTIFYYGNEPYWLVTLFAPILGGIIGALIYIFFVGSHLDDHEEEEILSRSTDSTASDDWRPMDISQSRVPMKHRNGHDFSSPYHLSPTPAAFGPETKSYYFGSKVHTFLGT